MIHRTIDVIMPVLDTPRPLLLASVSSFHSQIGCDESSWNLKIVDDGSTSPETLSTLDDFRNRSIEVITSPTRIGQAAARNLAVASSSAEYIAFLDADDEWFIGSLYTRLAAAVDNRANFVWSSFIHRMLDSRYGEVRPPGPLIRDLCCGNCNFPPDKEQAATRLREHNITIPLTVLMSRALFNAVGGFEPALVCSEDWLLWRRAIEHPDSTIFCVTDPAGYYHTFTSSRLLNQSRRLIEPAGAGGFHLDTNHSMGRAGEYLDEAAKERAVQMTLKSRQRGALH